MGFSDERPWRVVALILAIRIASVFLVQTSFVPDEYWQSLEVAHKNVFGYGHLTWEWTSGIRSYLYPGVIIGVYKILELLSIDKTLLLIYIPRVIQALLTATADYAFYKWSGNRKWALFISIVQWFTFYSGSRTLTNTAEMALTTLALARYPFDEYRKYDMGWFCLACLSCAIRPTAAIIWLPLCLNHLITTRESRKRLVFMYYIPTLLSIFGLSTALDSYFHGSFIITPWEFLKLNIYKDIGSFYGVEPWYWYLTIGLPVVLGVHFIPFVLSAIESIRHRNIYKTQCLLLAIIALVLITFSALPHKEFRFLLPIIPMVNFITQDSICRWSRKARSLFLYLVFGYLLIGNALPIGYFGGIHQRGTLDVMPILRETVEQYPSNTSLLFLMPCHSTPLYSHIHTNIPMRFLTCEPNLSERPNYVDEADAFFENPTKWFHVEYLSQQVGESGKRTKLPSHLIMFDTLVPKFGNILSYYDLEHTIFHTQYPTGNVGNNVLIYKRHRQQKPAGTTPS